jgi:hypothetical protein
MIKRRHQQTATHERSWGRTIGVAAGVVFLVGSATLVTSTSVAAAAGSVVTYTASSTIATPGPLKFSGSPGGDGWAVAIGTSKIFNVFHHGSALTVSCQVKATAAACWSPKTITDGSGVGFATSASPGLYLDQASGHLFVYAARSSDFTAGVVCIDTTLPNSASGLQLFCGFTPLSAIGDAPYALQNGVSLSGLSDPVQVGNHWYAFNAVQGTPSGTEDKLLCFSLTTFAACNAQPYAVPFGTNPLSFTAAAPIGKIGSDIMIELSGSTLAMTCFSTVTLAPCSGTWPVALSALGGAPLPMLNAAGTPIGVCVPAPGIPCFNLSGGTVSAPPNLTTVFQPNTVDGGPPVVIGTKVYGTDPTLEKVDCFDFATDAACPNYPLALTNLSGLYTVNADPLNPSCIWVNSDHGTSQIQNFDAITGGACQQEIFDVQAANFVAPGGACHPSNYASLQLTNPTRNTYTSATVAFDDASGIPLPNVPQQTLDQNGSVNLAALNLTAFTPLPEFVINLVGETSVLPQVSVTLSWTGPYLAACTANGQQTSGGIGPPPPQWSGYRLVASDGGIFDYGSAGFYGSTGNLTLNKPIVGMAATPDEQGYWLVASDGGIFAYGEASFFGSTGNLTLNKPIVGMAATPDGQGYWMVASDGGIFAFGDARFHGSTGNKRLNRPIVGMAATPDGKGYWLVASDGGIFAYGNAPFFGSTGNLTLNKPIVGMAATPDGQGYWLVASDGGIFAYGDAHFYGSTGNIRLNQPIVGMARTPDSGGYWLVASDGGIFAYGNAHFYGSTGNIRLNQPIVGMAA